MAFSHIGLPVGSHHIAMRNFYTAILEPLGYGIKLGNGEGHEFCGLGTNASGPIFWLGLCAASANKTVPKYDGNLENRIAPIHLAFDSTSPKEVDEWCETAM